METKLYIKNMVCNRCKMVVRSVFAQLKLNPVSIELGEVTLEKAVPEKSVEPLKTALQELGFELIDDRKSRLIEKIKNLIIQLVHHSDDTLSVNLSAYIAAALHYEYNYLSNLFSSVEGITIEKYYIAQRIERAKELLMYDELTLSEVAYRLGYSSVAHLSSQFKKQTGLTPSFYKSMKQHQRKNLDQL